MFFIASDMAGPAAPLSTVGFITRAAVTYESATDKIHTCPLTRMRMGVRPASMYVGVRRRVWCVIHPQTDQIRIRCEVGKESQKPVFRI